MKLLIIDDTKSVHAFFTSILDDYQVESVHAMSGEEGLTILKDTTDIDVVLLDWEMPGLNGLETLKEIRQAMVTPVLMVTSKNNQSNFAQAFENGADDYILKPFTAETIIEKIQTITGETISAKAS